jgi:hypothetical protein
MDSTELTPPKWMEIQRKVLHEQNTQPSFTMATGTTRWSDSKIGCPCGQCEAAHVSHIEFVSEGERDDEGPHFHGDGDGDGYALNDTSVQIARAFK